MFTDDSLRIIQWAGRGYCCTQILLGLALEDAGIIPDADTFSNSARQDFPSSGDFDEQEIGALGAHLLLRAAQGLCLGGGTCAGSCGILAGGKLLLSLYAGKKIQMNEAHPALSVMIETYHHWFTEYAQQAYGGSSCETILGIHENASTCCAQPVPDATTCGPLLAEAYTKLCILLQENSLDITDLHIL